MKLRLTQDEARFRLSADEVARLAEGERLEESAPFGTGDGGVFTWAMERSEHSDNVGLRWSGGRLTVTMPGDLARHLAASNDDGIEVELPMSSQRRLTLTIEKDLPPRRK